MRFRRHVPSRSDRAPRPAEAPVAAPLARRRLSRDVAVVLATFGVGYVVASVWLSPVPLITSDHAVPRVLELPVDEAQAKLAELGFRTRVGGDRSHGSIPRGSVAWQDPPPGVVLPENSVVVLSPSAGPTPIPVPDVIGFTRAHAEKVLVAAGLRLGDVDTVASDPEAGVVIATRPAPGSGREAGAPVDLVVSGRRPPGPMPLPAAQVEPLGAGEPRP
ncbi:MAG TPA: PASTA domain-containing protein [Gemmatimonadales bacterium]|nr:PASTA domain-containing protein [Gemmatimonadales bacterium]